MKKLLAVVAVCVALVGSLFAENNFVEVGAGYSIMPSSNGSLKAVGIDVRGTFFSQDKVGIGSSFTYNFTPAGVLWMDFQGGVAYRAVDASRFSLVLTPAIDVNFLKLTDADGTISEFAFGVAADVAANFKITNSIFLTGNFNFACSTYGIDICNVPGYYVGPLFGKMTRFNINPYLGVTFQF